MYVQDVNRTTDIDFYSMIYQIRHDGFRSVVVEIDVCGQQPLVNPVQITALEVHVIRIPVIWIKRTGQGSDKDQFMVPVLSEVYVIGLGMDLTVLPMLSCHRIHQD